MKLPATAAEFRAWRDRMAAIHGGRYSQADAARDLGKRVLQIKRYESERKPAPIPRDTQLACAALEIGLHEAF